MVYGFQHSPDIMIEDLLVFLPKHFSGVRFETSLRDKNPMDFRWFDGVTSVIKSVQTQFFIEAFMREISVKVPNQLVKENPNFRSLPILREFGWLQDALEDLDVASLRPSADGEKFRFQEFYRRLCDSSRDTGPVKVLVPICSQVDERKYSGPGPGYEHEEAQFHETFHRMTTPNGAVCKIAVRNMEQGKFSMIEEAAMMFEFQGTFMEIKNQRAFFESQMGQKFSKLHEPFAFRDSSDEEDSLIHPWDEETGSNS